MTDEIHRREPAETGEQEEGGVQDQTVSPPELTERIEELESELAQMEDRYLRAAAELRNYRKRVADQRVQQLQYAHEQLVTALLPVLDHIELALQSAETEDQSSQEVLAGVEMIHRQVLDVLQQFGLERVETVGEQFDPRIHKVVERRIVDDEAVNSGEIVEESRPGYKLHDRLIRPAEVYVCVKQEVAGQKPADGEQSDS